MPGAAGHSKRPFRWGILAAGGIARKFAADLKSQGMLIQAVASRSADKARAFADAFGIPTSYGDYSALLEDGEVDGVYIAAPNSLHLPWTTAAARAGKHILCEKPFTWDPMAAEGVLREVSAAGVFFMEAFMYRCHPQWQRVRSLLDQGAIGDIRLIEARFSYDLGDSNENIRLNPVLQGGAWMDVGCYGLDVSRWIMKSEPISISAQAHVGFTSGVDEWSVTSLSFGSGALASIQCAARVAQPPWVAVYGGKGRIEIPQPWHPPANGAEIICVISGNEQKFVEGDGLPLYAREAKRVEAAIAAGKTECEVMPWSETLKQAAAMARWRLSAGLEPV